MKNKLILIFVSIILLSLGFWIGTTLSFMFKPKEKGIDNIQEILNEVDIKRENYSLLLKKLEELCPNLGEARLLEGNIKKVNSEHLTVKGTVLLCWPLKGKKEMEFKVIMSPNVTINKREVDSDCKLHEEKLNITDLKNEMFVEVRGEGKLSDATFIAEELIVRDKDFWQKTKECF